MFQEVLADLKKLLRPILQVEACGICKDPLLQVFLLHLKTEVSKLDLSEPVDPFYHIQPVEPLYSQGPKRDQKLCWDVPLASLGRPTFKPNEILIQ